MGWQWTQPTNRIRLELFSASLLHLCHLSATYLNLYCGGSNNLNHRNATAICIQRTAQLPDVSLQISPHPSTYYKLTQYPHTDNLTQPVRLTPMRLTPSVSSTHSSSWRKPVGALMSGNSALD